MLLNLNSVVKEDYEVFAETCAHTHKLPYGCICTSTCLCAYVVNTAAFSVIDL